MIFKFVIFFFYHTHFLELIKLFDSRIFIIFITLVNIFQLTFVLFIIVFACVLKKIYYLF